MLDGYIYTALRTPFGRHAGALARMRPDDMLASVISAVVEQGPFDPAGIEDVVVGCANQAGEDSRCVGRHAGLLGGSADRGRRARCCSAIAAAVSTRSSWRRRRSPAARARCLSPAGSRA